jgi:hypothetical protein
VPFRRGAGSSCRKMDGSVIVEITIRSNQSAESEGSGRWSLRMIGSVVPGSESGDLGRSAALDVLL